ncbi:uncharacterized protein [Clytia hemisphaerica]|uniref:MYND-type domain-containing protein n=1 Tax=Clytia hemisphaerica TaxID=252671 RepID=A0A7M5X055_9CNID
MVQMSHHLAGSNSHGPGQPQPSFLAVRPPVTSFSERRGGPGPEFAQMSPEEVIAFNRRELAKTRQKEDWRQKQFEMSRHDLNKRPLIAPTEDIRKHNLEKDAYFKANQEYLRLMNDEPSRQTFREKQRLTEDLEKQKRLLIEDLARDQQLKQDKYKRNHVPGNYPADMRTLHYLNEANGPSRDIPLSLRLKPDGSGVYPFDPRFPQPLSTPEDFQNYRRAQDKMLALEKQQLENRQCSHSDFRHIPRELGSIIQEKEKKIKEMEEKIVKLEHEEKIHYFKKMEAAGNPAAARDMIYRMERQAPHHPPPPAGFRYLPASSPSRLPSQTNSASPTSSTSPRANLVLTNSSANIIEKKESPISDEKQPQTVFNEKDNHTNTTDRNNNALEEQKYITKAKDERLEPNGTTSPIGNSNSSTEDLVIDEKRESTVAKNPTPQPNDSSNPTHQPPISTTENMLKRQDSNCINLAPSANDDSVTTEVVDDDKTFNVRYGSQTTTPTDNSVSSPRSPVENIEDSKQSTEVTDPDPESSENQNGKPKKKGFKTSTKKEDVPLAPSDFQASQNRLSLDLPGHNWLEKRLKQQQNSSTVGNDTKISHNNSTMSRPQILNEESDLKVQQKQQEQDKPVHQQSSVPTSQTDSHHEQQHVITTTAHLQQLPRSHSTEVITQDESPRKETIHQFSPPKTIGNHTAIESINTRLDKKITSTDHEPISIPNIPVTVTSKPIESHTEVKKTPPSELLLKMLDPRKNGSSSSSPQQIPSTTAVINLSHTVPTNSALVSALLGNESTSVRQSSHPQQKKSIIIVKDPLLSPAPSSIHDQSIQRPLSPRSSTSDGARSRTNSESNLPMVDRRTPKHEEPYQQEVRPNLILERRRDDAYMLSKGQPPQGSLNSDYSKFIIEERYNRKRPLEEPPSKEDKEIALRRTEFSERFFSDLERGMSAKGKIEMTVLGEQKELPRSLGSSMESLPGVLQRRSLEELQSKERFAKMESADYNYLSRFRENQSQPSFLYKSSPSDIALKSPGSKSVNDFNTKRQLSPPHPSFRTHEERIAFEKNLRMQHHRSASESLPPVLNGRFDSGHHLPTHRRPESVDPILLNSLQSRERELNLMEEARRREEIHRSALEASRKERLLSQSVPVSKMQAYKTHPSPEEHLMNLNEKVRTVEDLRALQLGMPVANGFQRYIRPETLRNERLTEREKLALREADLIQASLRQDAITSRQDIHNAYLKRARRKPSLGSGNYTTLPGKHPAAGGIPPPHLPTVSGFTTADDHLKMASLRRQQEEEEKFRERHPERIPIPHPHDQREGFPHPKDIESGHFDPTIPRFFSHKIPRTRDGSLDFGRSKPVDYSFLDYSNPNFQAREAALHNTLKRPGSAHVPPSETMAKLQRRSPPHEFLPGKHRLPDAIPVPKPPGAPDINHYEEKWRALSSSSDSTEKRFCSICNKDAQYLCSGCRKVWYCSQECQLSAWKTHSKSCTLVHER